MANFLAISAAGKAILRLLENANQTATGEVFAGAHFDLFSPGDFQNPVHFVNKTDVGASLYLYRVGLNAARRNPGMQPAADRRQVRYHLPLDLYYLLTPWATSPDMAQRILGWAMSILNQNAFLPAALLNSVGPEKEIFRTNESLEIIFDPLPLADMALLWEQLKDNRAMASVSYLARVVIIESEVAIKDDRLVQTRQFDGAVID